MFAYHNLVYIVFFLQLEAPFKPEIKDETDVSNFDPDFTAEHPQLTPPDACELTTPYKIVCHVQNSW